jgi:hypothetical protein
MSYSGNTYKGRFKPKNPLKYKGDAENIIYRSSWEVRVMKYLDENPSVIWWASEEMFVRYYSPVDNKIHRYFPDFLANVRRKDNSSITYMIEVKPEKETKPPVQKRKTKRYIQESVTYIINQSKWKAATEFCKDHGWEFKVVTEKDLGI